jgi:RNA polymerase sigma factor (sigma-70 family)
LPDEALVVAARSGEADAFGTLFERWFDPVYDVARNIVRNPDTAADVAQDTFVVAWERLGTLERPEAFGGWLLRIARNKGLNRLEREGRSHPYEAAVVTGMHDDGAPDPVGSTRAVGTDEHYETNERAQLIAVAAATLGERDASLLDLHLRHGLTATEIADELGVTPNNAHQLLFRLRGKLGNAVSASMLWRDGTPTCGRLASELASVDQFDGSTVDVIDRHSKTCEDCAGERKALVAPWKLFAAVPIAIAPLALRARTADALQLAGVPVRGGLGSGGGGAAGSSAAGGGSAPLGGGVAGVGGAAGGGSGLAGVAGWLGLAAASVLSVTLAVGVATTRDDAEQVASAPTVTTVVTSPPASSTVASVAPTLPGDDEPPTPSIAPGDPEPAVPVLSTPTPAPENPTDTTVAGTVTATTTAGAPTTTAAAVPTTTPTTTAATPTTTPTTAAATTTTPTPAAPTIVSFVVSPPSTGTIENPPQCRTAEARPRRFSWETINAISATLTVDDTDVVISPDEFRSSDFRVVCATRNSVAVLQVRSADGASVSRTAVVSG